MTLKSQSSDDFYWYIIHLLQTKQVNTPCNLDLGFVSFTFAMQVKTVFSETQTNSDTAKQRNLFPNLVFPQNESLPRCTVLIFWAHSGGRIWPVLFTCACCILASVVCFSCIRGSFPLFVEHFGVRFLDLLASFQFAYKRKFFSFGSLLQLRFEHLE